MTGVIRDKHTMYAILTSGQLGNTNPSWPGLDAWLACPGARRYGSWGIRSASVAGHPATAMYVPSNVVPAAVAAFNGEPVNISPMVDTIATVTAWLNIWDADDGLTVELVEYPLLNDPRRTWRDGMRKPERRIGTAARFALRRHLNPNSYDDLMDVLAAYPGHVVEISALDRCFGTIPHRNGIVWEVRAY